MKKISLDLICKPKDPAEIDHELQIRNARSAAIRHIGIASKSSGHMRDFLSRLSFDEAIIEETLAELIKEGYIDDQKQARRTLRQRQAGKSESQAAIRNRLARQGVDQTVISSLTSDLPLDDISSLEIVCNRFSRELQAFKQADRDEKKRLLGKMNRFLQSRGYSSDCARQAINKAVVRHDLEAEITDDELC